MKNLIYLSFILAIGLFSSCKKATDDDKETRKGLVTPVGTPDGNAVSKMIDATGGSLTSEDGRIKVDIPAGALSTAQTISIQPITNHTPGGVRNAYRITPHGVQFSKPVTIMFTYTDADTAGTVPELLGIAYQDNEGIWQAVNATQVNKTNKTVSVATTHFSDWSLIEPFILVPAAATIRIGTNLSLKIKSYYADETEFGLLPRPVVSPLEEGKILPAQFIEGWTCSDGILSSRGIDALYTAPSTVPASNPVAIACKIDFGTKGKFLLVSNITIIDFEEGFTISAGAGPGEGFHKLTRVPGHAYIPPGLTKLAAHEEGSTTQNAKSIEITFPGKKSGEYAWSRNGNIRLTYTVRVNGVNTVYYAEYSNGITWFNSGGSLKITNYPTTIGDFIEGEFKVDPSGYANGNKTTTSVSGRFRVRLDF